jgi:flagellin-specific chaperone FliS
MLRLYLFINGRLAEAIRGDQARLPEALRILRHVRETWHEAAQIARAGR